MRKPCEVMKEMKIALVHAETRLLCCETGKETLVVMRKLINKLEEIERFYSNE